jgi:hypothetical protein
MPSVEPELLTLLMAERLAFERLQRLRGYPDDVVKAADDLWREAAEAVRQLAPPIRSLFATGRGGLKWIGSGPAQGISDDKGQHDYTD